MKILKIIIMPIKAYYQLCFLFLKGIKPRKEYMGVYNDGHLVAIESEASKDKSNLFRFIGLFLLSLPVVLPIVKYNKYVDKKAALMESQFREKNLKLITILSNDISKAYNKKDVSLVKNLINKNLTFLENSAFSGNSDVSYIINKIRPIILSYQVLNIKTYFLKKYNINDYSNIQKGFQYLENTSLSKVGEDAFVRFTGQPDPTIMSKELFGEKLKNELKLSGKNKIIGSIVSKLQKEFVVPRSKIIKEFKRIVLMDDIRFSESKIEIKIIDKDFFKLPKFKKFIGSFKPLHSVKLPIKTIGQLQARFENQFVFTGELITNTIDKKPIIYSIIGIQGGDIYFKKH